MPSLANDPAHADLLALRKLAAPATITVTSPSFVPDGPVPVDFSHWGDDTNPVLEITHVPPGAVSLVLLVEDPDAPSPPYPKPFIHWVVVNLPPATPFLRAGVPKDAKTLPDLGNALQGLNSAGKTGYTGMWPPSGDAPHHYHFGVFALDARLAFDAPPDRDAVLAAMRGHVLATGSLVGRFAAPE